MVASFVSFFKKCVRAGLMGLPPLMCLLCFSVSGCTVVAEEPLYPYPYPYPYLYRPYPAAIIEEPGPVIIRGRFYEGRFHHRW